MQARSITVHITCRITKWWISVLDWCHQWYNALHKAATRLYHIHRMLQRYIALESRHLAGFRPSHCRTTALTLCSFSFGNQSSIIWKSTSMPRKVMQVDGPSLFSDAMGTPSRANVLRVTARFATHMLHTPLSLDCPLWWSRPGSGVCTSLPGPDYTDCGK